MLVEKCFKLPVAVIQNVEIMVIDFAYPLHRQRRLSIWPVGIQSTLLFFLEQQVELGACTRVLQHRKRFSHVGQQRVRELTIAWSVVILAFLQKKF
jgi:hypothetical protein